MHFVFHLLIWLIYALVQFTIISKERVAFVIAMLGPWGAAFGGLLGGGDAPAGGAAGASARRAPGG